jgi:predicted RNA-binding protein YlqC (UPF0109 family)
MPGPVKSESLVRLVEVVARALVDFPDRVHVERVKGDKHPRIELQVAPEDIGKVIGKDGRTAQSIRVLLNAAATKAGAVRAFLDIVD